MGNNLQDPFEQATWNLDQALIWYAARNPRAVTDASDRRDDHKGQQLTWLVYGQRFVDAIKIQNEFIEQLQRGTVTAKWEYKGELEVLERSWLQHAFVHIDSELVASLHRTDLESDSVQHEALGIPIKRHYTRRVAPRFEPAQLTNVFPQQANQDDFRDNPEIDGDEPEICLADAVQWLAEKYAQEAGTTVVEEHDRAQQGIVIAARNKRLTIRGYKCGDHGRRRLAEISPLELRELEFSVNGGQPEFDRRRHGSRFYGVGWAQGGPVDLWTGIFLTKSELRDVFTIAESNKAESLPASIAATSGLPRVATKVEVDAYYVEWVSRHEGRKPPSREDDETEMRKRFPQLTRDRARELRNRLAPDSWKQKGRPKLAN